VFEKTTPIHSTSPSITWFKDRWVLLWQDGKPWEPYDGPWWYWISESKDGREWSEPRRMEFPEGKDAMRTYSEGLCLMNCCVVGDKLAFLTHQFAGHMDLYTSEDTVKWTAHPRFRTGMNGRGVDLRLRDRPVPDLPLALPWRDGWEQNRPAAQFGRRLHLAMAELTVLGRRRGIRLHGSHGRRPNLHGVA